jgi:hypothetical protein
VPFVDNEENEVILNTESLHLYDVTASIEAKSTIIVNGNKMTIKEFREMKNKNPKEGHWGRKAINEMDNELI